MDIGFHNRQFNNDWKNSVRKHVEKTKPVIFLLGLDDIDFTILKDAFVVYMGHHGDCYCVVNANFLMQQEIQRSS